jgi:hypothetical protein
MDSIVMHTRKNCHGCRTKLTIDTDALSQNVEISIRPRSVIVKPLNVAETATRFGSSRR